MQIEKLKELGGTEWKSGEKHRIYFNNVKSLYKEALNIEVSYYKTGNVCTAYVDGERISNSKFSKMMSGTVFLNMYYDVKLGEFVGTDCSAFEVVKNYLTEKAQEPGMQP